MKHRIDRSRMAGRVAALLLATTCLTPLLVGLAAPAWADGGAGGSNGGSAGGAGGTGFGGSAGGPGGSGPPDAGGGGGGAGGGAGGLAGGLSGATGGAGGLNGANAASITNTTPLAGAAGGAGGAGGPGGGGGGGAGGYGAVITGNSLGSSNTSTITGATGGTGGTGSGGGNGGNGGDGGVGVQVTGGAAGFTNSGTVTGGAGGAGGGGSSAGSPGAGGTGFAVSGFGDINLINSGTISGGLGGDGTTRANAITFINSGFNLLQLQAGSTIVGNVVAVSGNSDTLALSGSVSPVTAFDVSTIGAAAQYRNFDRFVKFDTSTWTLTGTTTAVTPWQINGGTLVISSDGNLGAAGTAFGLSGGTLRTTASLSSARNITLVTGSTFSPDAGTTLTLSGTINGSNLAKSGAGTLVLSGTNVYTATTTVSSGLINFSAVNNFGTSHITLDGGGLQWATGSTTDISSRLNALGAGGGTFDTNGNNVTLATAIGGVGGVTKSGSGTLSLTGNNGYQGGTFLTDGTVAINNGNVLGTGTVQFQGGALLGTLDLTLSNDMALGAGTSSTIAASTNTTLTLTPSSFSSGAGSSLTFGSSSNTGTVALTVPFLSPTPESVTVAGGTLALSSFSDFSLSSLTVNGGATFDISNNGDTPIGALAGGGTVQLGSNRLGIFAAAGEFSGTIADGGNNGGLVILAGTQTLSGVNTYTNGTQIDSGATLVLKGNGSIASSFSVFFGGFSGTATFDISQTNSGASVGGLSDIAGIGVVNLGSKTLTITGGADFFGVIADGGIAGGSGGGLVIGANALQNLGGVNTYTGATTVMAGATLGLLSSGSIAASSGLNLAGVGATFDLSLSGIDQTIKDLSGVAGSTILLGDTTLTVGTANSTAFAGIIDAFGGNGGLVKQGSGTLTLSGANTYTGGTTINAGLINFAALNNFGTGMVTLNGGGLQWASGTSTDISSRLVLAGTNAAFDTNGNNVTFASALGGTGGITKAGAGILTLGATNTYAGGTTVTGGFINFSAAGNFGSGMVTLNGGGLQWAAGSTADISSKLAPLGAGGGILDTNGNNVTFATGFGGPGGLTKTGTGILTLGATNTYSGGTTVIGGFINFSAANNFGTGLVTLNGGGLQWAAGSTADISSKLAPLGAGGGILDTNGNNVTLASAITGTGGLAKQGLGTLNLTGTNTYSGGTAVLAGTLAVNGSVTGNVAVGSAGTLGGTGTIFGNVVNAGTLAPGNSIGTLNINGNFTQAAGSIYQVEVNAAGQGDRINATGAATIQGGTVQVLAQPGNYGASTTYTILNATGGRTGTYSGVTSNFAFLTPSLSYDPNNVFLTLALPQQNAFTPTFLALTPNQRAVGAALNQSFANASGDFATVIGVLAGLSTAQGPLALDTISGQPYADLGTMNTNNSAMFMNAIGQQMASARGASTSTTRTALAQACDIAACDGPGPLSAWISALGGLGSVLGDTNASTLTYNFGGAAAGVDYRLDPRFLVGIGAGYTHGTQWVNSFLGQGWTDSVSVAAYGSFTQSGFYVDALAGYAYFNNQLQRQIVIPGLQQRTASGSTGANQFLGQVEGGYKLGVYAPAMASITPFGRFQISSVTQNGFTESGANSLSLNVAQQTTNSQRTTIGADFAGAVGLGNERKLDLALRLGWMHEFADTGRPITAAFAGAPASSFTVFGATPLRNSAVVGFSASTAIAQSTSLYLRYDGEVASGTDNHALTAGLRMSW